jgi:hypothetical protein
MVKPLFGNQQNRLLKDEDKEYPICCFLELA